MLPRSQGSRHNLPLNRQLLILDLLADKLDEALITLRNTRRVHCTRNIMIKDLVVD
jgi:hypothetical protein